jgi:hypothetical protein
MCEDEQEQPFQAVGSMNDRCTTKHYSRVTFCLCYDVHADLGGQTVPPLFFMFRGILTSVNSV